MIDNSGRLPEFTNPPVVEVALGIQFEPIQEIRTPQLGFLWNEYRDRFPRIEEHAPVAHAHEWFGVPDRPRVMTRLEMSDRPPLPRVWFLTEDGAQLIQIQQDRFVHNWRKVGSKDTYPRYEQVRSRFERELTSLESLVRREAWGEVSANLCEVTYVNHILPGEIWKRHGEVHKVLAVMREQSADAFLTDAEAGDVSLRYVISGKDGQPLGRLHVNLESRFRSSDNLPMFVLTVMARGRPLGDGLPGVLRFLDLGREWVVRGFASVTTREMQLVWGKANGD